MTTENEQKVLLLKNEILKNSRSRYVRQILQTHKFSYEELIHLQKTMPRKRRRSLLRNRPTATKLTGRDKNQYGQIVELF